MNRILVYSLKVAFKLYYRFIHYIKWFQVMLVVTRNKNCNYFSMNSTSVVLLHVILEQISNKYIVSIAMPLVT